jgi:hypothetical protein
MDHNRRDLSQRIIDHLKLKKENSDLLDDIIIAMYDNEMKNLSEDILTSLNDLISKGIIVENKKNDNKTLYKLKTHNHS